MENEVLKAIKERRSIRRYKADQITDEELKTVLEAGTWAATGHGTQEPFIIAVQNPETCAQLRKMNAKVMGVESDPYYGAPTIVIGFGSREQCERHQGRQSHPRQYDVGSPLYRSFFLLDQSRGCHVCFRGGQKSVEGMEAS